MNISNQTMTIEEYIRQYLLKINKILFVKRKLFTGIVLIDILWMVTQLYLF